MESSRHLTSFNDNGASGEQAGISSDTDEPPAEIREIFPDFDDPEAISLDDDPLTLENAPSSTQESSPELRELDLTVEPSTDSLRLFLHSIGRVPLLSAVEERQLARKIRAGVLAEKILENVQFMSYDKSPKQGVIMNRLTRKIQSGQAAKEHMNRANLRLVVSIARRYTSFGLDLLDLIQEGSMGLYRAVEKFDPERGFKFSTYATWWIRQAIERAIGNQANTIRIPMHMVENRRRLTRAEKRLVARLGRQPTLEEIAEDSGMSIEKVMVVRDSEHRVVSLDKPIGDGDASLGDLVEDQGAQIPDEVVDLTDRKASLGRALRSKFLSERERRVIELRYGLKDDNPWTLDQIGKALGLTRERIRQMEQDALRKLREAAKNEGLGL